MKEEERRKRNELCVVDGESLVTRNKGGLEREAMTNFT
jgi:hypothetical protein